MHNVFNDLTNIVCKLLTTVQIGTLITHNQTLDLWTSTNQFLTTHQVSDPIVAYNPQAPAGQQYTWVVDNSLPPDIIAQQQQIVAAMNDVVNNKNDGSAGSISAFIQTIFTGTTNYSYAMSEALGTSFLGFIQRWWDTSATGSESTAQMSTISGINQLVQSNAQDEEQPGQTAAKNEGSVITNDASVTTNLSELLNQALGIGSNIATILGNQF